MNTKTCLKCKIKRTLNNFSKNKTTKDGYHNWCKDCHKKYQQKNKEKLRIYNKKYSQKNKKYYKQHQKEYRIKHPWYASYSSAKQRCANSNHQNYKYYGGKGIKFLMTVKDFKFLWFRDKAYLMIIPSIDRKNSNKNYILKNCQFMELSENTRKRHKRSKK